MDLKSSDDCVFVCFSGKYYLYDNYFDLPGALLCARVVDSLDQVRTGPFEIKYSFLCITCCVHSIMHALLYSTNLTSLAFFFLFGVKNFKKLFMKQFQEILFHARLALY